jgi:hypothetical protein
MKQPGGLGSNLMVYESTWWFMKQSFDYAMTYNPPFA